MCRFDNDNSGFEPRIHSVKIRERVAGDLNEGINVNNVAKLAVRL